MSRDKLHLLKQGIGKYITFKSFLSTTINKSRALDFINKTDMDHKKQVIVLYAIEMNDENNIQQLVQPFANVTFISCTKHEPEILFSIGQVFKIRSIIENEVTRVWTVYLEVLRANETEHLANITNYYLSKIVGKETFYNGIQARVNYEPLTITTFVTIGNYYSSIIVKDYDKAEFYYQKFLEEELESPDDFDFEQQPAFYYNRVPRLYYLAHGHINLQLAYIRLEQRKHEESYEYIDKVWKASSKLARDSDQYTLIIPLSNILVKLFWEKNRDYDEIAKYYLHPRQLDRNNAEKFINIGIIQISAELYSFALNSFITALSIIETHNETDYLSYGLIYREIGQIYEKTEEPRQALLYYWKAYEIYKKSIPSNHELRRELNDDIKRISTIEYNVHEDL